MEKHWYKFYECGCMAEGIMLSTAYYDKDAKCVDLAFFQHGLIINKKFTLKDRLRWCWYILTRGLPFIDMVILTQEIAKELGTDLLKFSGENKC